MADAGTILAAADALRSGRQTFTGQQVAFLLSLAYDSGRTATYREDVAEMHSVWEDRRAMRRTYEERVAERMAAYAAAAERINVKLGRPPGYVYLGGAVDWETGQPARPHLRRAA